jgi:hypothetical protein
MSYNLQFSFEYVEAIQVCACVITAEYAWCQARHRQLRQREKGPFCGTDS